MIKEINAKTAIHYHKQKIVTNYDLNIYRGCEHKCKYCFAQYSHDYLNSDFFNDIFVKINIAEILDFELNKKSWKHDFINISGVSDCYQPIEKQYQIMPKILKVLIKHKNPILIVTKSPLILRDYDLICKLAQDTHVNIYTSISTLDDNIRQQIEPNTVSSIERINFLKEFNKVNLNNLSTGILLMPIIPYLTDTINNLENIFKLAKENNIKSVTTSAMHLRGNLKKNFFNFLQSSFSEVYLNIQKIYKNAYISESYNLKLNKFLFYLRKKYNLYNKNMPEIEKIQMEFGFDRD